MTDQIQAYVTCLQLLLESLNCQQTVRLTRQLAFSWNGAYGLSDGAFRQHGPQQEIIYELVMAIYCQAFCRYSVGVGLLRASSAKEAAKAFLEAASVFQYLAEETLPRWLNRDRLPFRVPETFEHVAKMCMHLCVACASQCVVAQAMERNSASSVLQKLCAAVVQSASDAIDQTSKPGCGDHLDNALIEHLAFLKTFYTALAFYHAGLVAKQGALAVAYFGACVAVLRQQGKAGDAANARHNAFQPGLPKLVGAYAPCISPIGFFLTAVRDLHESADSDNRIIYFEAPIAAVDLPESVFLAKVTKFAPPPIGIIVQFTYTAPAPAPAPAPALKPVAAPAQAVAAAAAAGLSVEDAAAIAAIDAAHAAQPNGQTSGDASQTKSGSGWGFFGFGGSAKAAPAPAPAPAYPAAPAPAYPAAAAPAYPAAAAASSASAPAMSDEEYARQLQKQLDEGGV